MTCECFNKIFDKLEEDEGVAYFCESEATGMNWHTGKVTQYPFSLRFKASHSKDRRKHKVRTALPTFCPFCGTRLVDEPPE